MLRPLLVLALLMLPACGSLQAPRTAIVGATLGDATEEAVEVDVLLELENPNAAPLRLEDVRYDVRVDGVTVSDMRRAPIATLESDGTRVLVLPGVIRYADLGWRIDDVRLLAAVKVV